MEQKSGQDTETVKVDTENGAVLVGSYYSGYLNKGIIMLPGIGGYRSSLEGFAKKLNNSGFNVWAFDLNSQGDSSGSWDLFQMQQSASYLQRHLKNRHGIKRMGGLGDSMGGMVMGLSATQKNSELECLCLTNTLSSIDSVVPNWVLSVAKYIPQTLVRLGSIGFDKLQADILKNPSYLEKTHPQFRIENGCQPYARFCGLKIDNFRKIVQSAINAPRLAEHACNISQPVLFIYGGKDTLLGVNEELPENLKKMYEETGSKEKKLVIVPGASHALNSPPLRMDDNLNQDPKYSWVKDDVVDHFCKYMLN
jgi:alpha-beta hydrolase superfamily lysophospholipase